ncbi:MAG: hypothetical protein KGI94_07305 [Paracoccaceae bacterium]|nr:hypothetical protein [Paracoccaceae bacterium]
MTALKQYQRLESPGIWRALQTAQRRDVIVSFGEATLIISDSRSETPLSHWSLPAVERLNPGAMPAIYGPGADAVETLEIDDPLMIEALETIHRVVEAKRPRPGRMRGWIVAAVAAGLIALAALWLPGALVRQTAKIVPPAERSSIGQRVLANITHISGTPCNQTRARDILDRLSHRLFGSAAPRIVVLRETPAAATHLPGDLLIVSRHLIEDHEGPDVLAGYLIMEQARARAEDPLLPLLNWAGLRATLGLLTSGHLPKGTLKGYGEALLTRPPETLPPQPLIAQFRAAGLPTTPYAKAADASGHNPTLDAMMTADPFAKAPPPRPLLNDDDWVALQGICAP